MDETIDFDAAERFLHVAREAHAKGDSAHCFAARKLVAIALRLRDAPPVFHTGHLKETDVESVSDGVAFDPR